MTLSITKTLALSGLCAVLAAVGTAASAQGYGDGGYRPHHPIQRAHRGIQRQKAAYSHDVRTGHYRAAEQAHLRAMALRHRIRHVEARRADHRVTVGDHAYYQGHRYQGHGY